MGMFILGLLILFAAVVLLLAPGMTRNPALGRFLGVVAVLIGITAVAFSTAISVRDDQGGIVIRHFGPDLPPNRVVAANGEKGPQASVLGPGWHFGFWPWLYSLEPVDTITVDPGHVGVVNALDGKPLPGGAVYAPEWPSADDMVDGNKFLTTSDAKLGFRGPQLTVLTPGRYRFNPRLFAIEQKPALVVAAGEVAVIKANDGTDFTATDEKDVVNGTALVPHGFRGIWREPLTPGAYYLHPDAYTVIKVMTTNRVYTYQEKKWAIKVRSKDGFTFPVDVRVSALISANDAPHLVALLANPDLMTKDDQEDEQLSVLEAKVILPLIRTIFRNVAEGMNALQFVNSRTEVEKIASQRMKEELNKFRIITDGVFIGNIDLDESEAGKQLLATQTDRELAINQQATFTEKKRAEESRATFIKAQAEAEQQKILAEATNQVLVKEQEAKARAAEAKGEADYIQITAQAKKDAYTAMAGAIGPQGVVQLELLKAVSEGKVQITPQVMVTGGGVVDALAGTLLRQMAPPPPAK